MADQRHRRKLGRETIVPPELGWSKLLQATGDDLETEYNHILTQLGKRTGTVGT